MNYLLLFPKLFKGKIYQEKLFENIKNEDKLLKSFLLIHILHLVFLKVPFSTIVISLVCIGIFPMFIILFGENPMVLGYIYVFILALYIFDMIFQNTLIWLLCKKTNKKISIKNIFNLYYFLSLFDILGFVLMIFFPFLIKINILLSILFVIIKYYFYVKGYSSMCECNPWKFSLWFLLTKILIWFSYIAIFWISTSLIFYINTILILIDLIFM